MIYFIHVDEGLDENQGTNINEPWKSFKPLQTLKLQPGDKVEVLTPGDFKNSMVINGEGTRENPIYVNFAPGRYDFFPDASQSKKFHISNNNDGIEQPKAMGIHFQQCKHVYMAGPGVTIYARGKMIHMCLDHSESITISDLKFDYHRPTVSEFTVVESDKKSADIKIHSDSNYVVENEQIIWKGEGWEYTDGLTQELDIETDFLLRCGFPLKGLKFEELEKNLVKVKGNHSLKKGNTYQVRDTFRDTVGVLIEKSKEVNLIGVDLIFTHGMGLLAQYSEDVMLENVRIAPDENSGRTSSCWADCTHFSGCRGNICIRNCTFIGAHDDAVNIHGTNLRVTEVVDRKKIKVRFMHKQTYGLEAFRAGDQVEYVHWESLEAYGNNTVEHVEVLNPHEMMISLKDEFSEEFEENDVLENITWVPKVFIGNCYVKHMPSRGFLVTTRSPVNIMQNHFENLRKGIHVESDAQGWYESGCVKDMLINENYFEKMLHTGISVSPHCTIANDSVHSNINIHSNTFILSDESTVMEVSGVDGLSVYDNKVEDEKLQTVDEIYKIVDCKNVNLKTD